MNFDLVSICAFLGAVVALMVDGRKAVSLAAVFAAIGIAPAAAYLGGSSTALLVLSVALVTASAGAISYRLAKLSRETSGLDPDVPMFSRPQALFGPRSARAAVGVLALPCASWVSFNVNLGGVSVVSGLEFPAAYVWLCGVGRILVARSVEDIGVAAGLIGLGTSVAWMIRDGGQSFLTYIVLLAMFPVAGAITGWLSGRHAHRVGVAT